MAGAAVAQRRATSNLQKHKQGFAMRKGAHASGLSRRRGRERRRWRWWRRRPGRSSSAAASTRAEPRARDAGCRMWEKRCGIATPSERDDGERAHGAAAAAAETRRAAALRPLLRHNAALGRPLGRQSPPRGPHPGRASGSAAAARSQLTRRLRISPWCVAPRRAPPRAPLGRRLGDARAGSPSDAPATPPAVVRRPVQG